MEVVELARLSAPLLTLLSLVLSVLFTLTLVIKSFVSPAEVMVNRGDEAFGDEEGNEVLVSSVVDAAKGGITSKGHHSIE